jgi:DNA-binding NtrC family response regulator
MTQLHIAILDDERTLADELGEYLTSLGHDCTVYYHPRDALSSIPASPPDILLLDLKLPETDGLTVLERIRAVAPQIEVIVMSGHGDVDSVTKAFRLGAFDFLQKSFSPADVQIALERTSTYQTLRRRFDELESRHAALTAGLSDADEVLFVGTSPAARTVLDLAERAAEHADTTVLITGESGTGKELLARRIHLRSARRGEPFVTVNCAAVNRELCESEFFGHVKGAYTGAAGPRAGYFQSANGGTVFLDEIGELPPSMQAKLLRVLEYGAFMPVGSDAERRVDVRVIAASNRDLAGCAERGEFRVDLYYRLQTFEVAVPPLRERREDLPLLVRHFREALVRQMGHPAPVSDDRLLELVAGYSFPGNVRELRNAVERAMITGHPGIDVGPHPDEPADDRASLSSTASAGTPLRPTSADLASLDLASLERDAIREALRRSGGVHATAARLLGISRQSLLRRLEKHHIE